MSLKLDYNKEYFETSELSLAATLICFGYSLDSLNKTNPSKVIFIFKRDKNLDQIVQDFWGRKKVLVDPLSYSEATRYLKSRIYGG